MKPKYFIFSVFFILVVGCKSKIYTTDELKQLKISDSLKNEQLKDYDLDMQQQLNDNN